MIVDEFLPLFDSSDELVVVVDADPASTWAALMGVDLLEVGRRRPLVAVLGALRILPEVVSHLLHGEAPPRAPAHLRLRDTTGTPRRRREAGSSWGSGPATGSRSGWSAGSGGR